MKTVLFLFLVSACSMLPFPGMGGGTAQTQTNQSSHSSSTQTEEMNVNGRPVALDDEGDDRDRDDDRRTSRREEDDDDRPKKKKSKKDMDFGKTCHKNNECENDACFVGYGDLGYCTKMCNSWSDCPSHWECKKPGNAPQRICMQDAD
ncbi:MAG: hypothetical protein AB7T06_25860 [Kofleriaceae bacterium]